MRPEDGLGDGFRSIVLLSPAEPGFWAHVTAAPEFADGGPDPLDRWSRRVIAALAATLGARALFPFGGPPRHPFAAWALRSGRAFSSPVQLFVHDTMGLWASWRGALALDDDLPARRSENPCRTCAGQPCRSACPVGALTDRGYDVALSRRTLDTAAGRGCMEEGCAVRRACPVSQRYGRLPAQSAHHMRHFHR